MSGVFIERPHVVHVVKCASINCICTVVRTAYVTLNNKQMLAFLCFEHFKEHINRLIAKWGW